MKKKITLLVIVLIILISELGNSQTSYGEKFYLGTFTFPNFSSYHSQYFFDKYDSLRYNLIVGYIGHFDYDPGCNPYGIKIWGGFFDNIVDSMYTYSINTMFTGFNNYYQNKGGFSLFLEREKILRPAYGQSSRHEAELTSSDTNTIRPAYFFNTANGTIYQDPDGTKGRVLYAGDTPKYFVKDMFENLEMVNVITDTNNSKNRDLWYNMGRKMSCVK